jgi:GTP cyclohydrolase II
MTPLEVKTEAALPVNGQRMRIRLYEYGRAGELVVALLHRTDGMPERPLVRIHSQCLTGDTFGSTRCDCGAQLRASLDAISDERWGLLLYLPSHEGRGIGLVNKIRAYALQDSGLDTVQANVALRLAVDPRRYDAPVAVLRSLGVRRIRLLTNNPGKLKAVRAAGIDAVRVPMPAFVTAENRGYLSAKQHAMGHRFPNLPAPGSAPEPRADRRRLGSVPARRA